MMMAITKAIFALVAFIFFGIALIAVISQNPL